MKLEEGATPLQKKRGKNSDMDPKVLKKRLKQMFAAVKNYQVNFAKNIKDHSGADTIDARKQTSQLPPGIMTFSYFDVRNGCKLVKQAVKLDQISSPFFTKAR